MTIMALNPHHSTSPRQVFSFLFFVFVLMSYQLYRKFRDAEPPAELGRDRDYAVDLIPKFIIASGELTNILVHTDVTRYLEFKQIAGSFVYRDGKISKVPSTEMEAVSSPLMGLFEKRRAKKFFEFVQNWKEEDPATHQGTSHFCAARPITFRFAHAFDRS
jgi:RAB protein geranylgeranyltransferase component A